MGFHHVALATKDLAATHAFYTEVMGFRLVKAIVGPTDGNGWAKHLFYDTGGNGELAFWELHDDAIGDDWRAGMSTAAGLPTWVNHLAFDAPDLEALAAHRRRWQEHGITVAEIDHGFCVSIYATDPNGTMVEFCCTTQPYTPADAEAAARKLLDPSPEVEAPPTVTIHPPLTAAAPA